MLQEPGIPRSVQLLGCHLVTRNAARGQRGPPISQQTSAEERRNDLKTALIPKLRSCSEKQLGRATQKTSTILRLHLDTMKSVSLDESWSIRIRRCILALSLSCDFSCAAFQKLSLEVDFERGSLEVDFERGNQGRSQEAEDSENKMSDQTHRDTNWQCHSYWQEILHIVFLGKIIRGDEK